MAGGLETNSRRPDRSVGLRVGSGPRSRLLTRPSRHGNNATPMLDFERDQAVAAVPFSHSDGSIAQETNLRV
jgi:hypothetical protein